MLRMPEKLSGFLKHTDDDADTDIDNCDDYDNDDGDGNDYDDSKGKSPVEEILRRVARYELVAKLENLQKTTFLCFAILIIYFAIKNRWTGQV